MQYVVLEYLRTELGQSRASHQETDGASDDNAVVAPACSLQGESRPVRPVRGTLFHSLVAGRTQPGVHFCSCAPTPSSIERLTDAGFTVGATSYDAGTEAIELPNHRFFAATLFSPQVGASTSSPFTRCCWRSPPRLAPTQSNEPGSCRADQAATTRLFAGAVAAASAGARQEARPSPTESLGSGSVGPPPQPRRQATTMLAPLGPVTRTA